MNLKFKFDCEGEYNVAEMPPHILLAYTKLKKDRTSSRILYLLLSILFCVVLYLSLNGNIPFLRSNELAGVSLIALIVCVSLFVKWMLDKKPESLKLYCCLITEDFENYVQSIKAAGHTMSTHGYIIKTVFHKRKQRKIDQIVATAQLLWELYDEIKDKNFDLIDDIGFIEEHIDGIKRFKVRRIDYGKEKRKKGNRNSVSLICRPKHGNRR